jgi:hypothetical protein
VVGFKGRLKVSDARLGYYRELLKIEWASMTPRQRKRLKRRELLLFLAIEGIMKYDR